MQQLSVRGCHFTLVLLFDSPPSFLINKPSLQWCQNKGGRRIALSKSTRHCGKSKVPLSIHGGRLWSSPPCLPQLSRFSVTSGEWLSKRNSNKVKKVFFSIQRLKTIAQSNLPIQMLWNTYSAKEVKELKPDGEIFQLKVWEGLGGWEECQCNIRRCQRWHTVGVRPPHSDSFMHSPFSLRTMNCTYRGLSYVNETLHRVQFFKYPYLP